MGTTESAIALKKAKSDLISSSYCVYDLTKKGFNGCIFYPPYMNTIQLCDSELTSPKSGISISYTIFLSRTTVE